MKHQNPQKRSEPRSRKHLNADALFNRLHTDFSKVSDCREGAIDISMADALMSGFAMFSLKDPSLLAFDKRRETDENLAAYPVSSLLIIVEIPVLPLMKRKWAWLDIKTQA